MKLLLSSIIFIKFLHGVNRGSKFWQAVSTFCSSHHRARFKGTWLILLCIIVLFIMYYLFLLDSGVFVLFKGQFLSLDLKVIVEDYILIATFLVTTIYVRTLLFRIILLYLFQMFGSFNLIILILLSNSVLNRNQHNWYYSNQCFIGILVGGY
jgi:hypothetical protein